MNIKAKWLALHWGASSWCMHYEVRGHTTKSKHETEGMSCIGGSRAIRHHKIIECSAASVSSLAREVGKCSSRYIFYHKVASSNRVVWEPK